MPSQHDILLRLTPDAPTRVLSALSTSPNPSTLASAADSNGYTLIHAAASYAHLDMLRTLVRTYGVNVNTRDNDGQTPLFHAETLEVAKCLVEELGADVGVVDGEGLSVLDSARADGEGEGLVGYLEGVVGRAGARNGMIEGGGENVNGEREAEAVEVPVQTEALARTRVPENVQVNFGTMPELPPSEMADPRIRAKIEELAARGDFESEEAQRELRNLVAEVVTGIQEEGPDRSRRRTGD
ncbi:hypothetical protein BT63DRAFT_480524 [Microthyrium microscopicum]|uniref:protein S-acyltransferase n=1 Tax=Microthyrium microscopicum TaxID=703497 RepID=A0A6A6U7F6_9PEZI|nr:hypothetical protein BT63DRAFT_480524 [Microthyrium microscopicum]